MSWISVSIYKQHLHIRLNVIVLHCLVLHAKLRMLLVCVTTNDQMHRPVCLMLSNLLL